MAVIAIDFDGTLCEHKFPDIGQQVPGAFAVLRELQTQGHQLILLTMRNDSEQGPYLSEALAWCRQRGVEFWAANDNPQQSSWTNSRKVYAHCYIDDAALGCPLRASFMVERPMVDWSKVREHLVAMKLL